MTNEIDPFRWLDPDTESDLSKVLVVRGIITVWRGLLEGPNLLLSAICDSFVW